MTGIVTAKRVRGRNPGYLDVEVVNPTGPNLPGATRS
jgi:hypothetical protein